MTHDSRLMTIDPRLQPVLARLAFRPGRVVFYPAARYLEGGGEEHSPAYGGWVNSQVQIWTGDLELGTAYLGWWVQTHLSEHSADEAAQQAVRRSGYAVRPYAGDERYWVLEQRGAMDELLQELGLSPDPAALDAAVVAAAIAADPTDPLQLFRAALQTHLGAVGAGQEPIGDLVAAAAAKRAA